VLSHSGRLRAALRWTDLDLAAGILRVERSWDFGGAADEELVAPKSSSGSRRVPIPAVLRDSCSSIDFAKGVRRGWCSAEELTAPSSRAASHAGRRPRGRWRS